MSDHKPVVLKIRTKMKKWRAAAKPQPSKKWEALRFLSKQQEFRRRTAELIENDEVGKTRGWEEISEILTKAARDICGVQSKKVENPWIAGHEEQLHEMRTEINKWIAARNRAMTYNNQITKRIFQRHLSKARRQMKRTLKHLKIGGINA